MAVNTGAMIWCLLSIWQDDFLFIEVLPNRRLRRCYEQYHKDFNKGYDEAGFCRVLAAAIDRRREDMDSFYAAKLAKGSPC